MSKPIGRSNLRARKSLKSIGQLECHLCKRHYFPIEFTEEDEDEIENENGYSTRNICVDCDSDAESKKQISHHKRITTSIKVENDPSFDECLPTLKQPIERGNVYTSRNVLTEGTMVKVHFSELLNASPIIPNDSIPEQVKVEEEKLDFVNWVSKEAKSPNIMERTLTNTDDVPLATTDDLAAILQPEEITKNDTIDTLRRKFPKASPFEFEFLLFLKNSSH